MIKTKKKKLNKQKLMIYLLAIFCFMLLVANYKLQGQTVWSDTADHYVTRLTIVRK